MSLGVGGPVQKDMLSLLLANGVTPNQTDRCCNSHRHAPTVLSTARGNSNTLLSLFARNALVSPPSLGGLPGERLTPTPYSGWGTSGPPGRVPSATHPSSLTHAKAFSLPHQHYY